MTVTFTVGNPVPTNRAYGRARRVDNDRGAFGGHQGLFLTAEGKRFKSAVYHAALHARMRSTWPIDPWRVARARLSYQLYAYRGDVDGPRKLIRDACQTVLYANDRIVEDGLAPLPVMDGGAKRVAITVELLEWRSVEEARALRHDSEQRALERMAKRQSAMPPLIAAMRREPRA